MIGSWFSRRRIWLYQEPLDFRKQLNGLVEIVSGEMEMKPNDNSIYVFRNRQRDKLKLVTWDRNGFVLGYKRLEAGQFDWPKEKNGQIRLSWEQLYLLISGLPMTKLNVIPKEKMQYFY